MCVLCHLITREVIQSKLVSHSRYLSVSYLFIISLPLPESRRKQIANVLECSVPITLLARAISHRSTFFTPRPNVQAAAAAGTSGR